MSTTAHVTALPTCDIHKYELKVEGVPAAYDARTHSGRWANVCEDCFHTHTVAKLGTGFGQRLVTEPEPEMSREDKGAAIDEAMRRGDLAAIEEIVGDGDIADWL